MLNRMLASFATIALCCSFAAAQQCQATKEVAKAEGCQATCSKGDGKTCCQSGQAKTAGCCSDKAGMPVMMYQVGTEKMACPKKASEVAKGDEKAIKFVVADKVYDNKAEAVTAYTSALETYSKDAMSVKFAVGDKCVACPMTAGEMAKKEGKAMKYRLASFDFASEEAAKKAAAAAKEAADKIEMKTMVGDKAMHCSAEAKEAAAKENKKVEYVVGQTKSCCDVEARMNLARARAEAVYAALEKAAKANA